MRRKQTAYAVTVTMKFSREPGAPGVANGIKTSRALAVDGVIADIRDYLREESEGRGWPLSGDGTSLDLDRLNAGTSHFGWKFFCDTEDEDFKPIRAGGVIPLERFLGIFRRKLEAMERLETEVHIGIANPDTLRQAHLDICVRETEV